MMDSFYLQNAKEENKILKTRTGTVENDKIFVLLLSYYSKRKTKKAWNLEKLTDSKTDTKKNHSESQHKNQLSFTELAVVGD